MLKSNITVASNIYVRRFPQVQNDDEFVRRVYGHKALNVLKTRFPKSYAAKFTKPQIEEVRQRVGCRNSKNKERVWGRVWVDGKLAWSCRCENTACHKYEECMKLPNAMRIVRVEYSSELKNDELETGVVGGKIGELTGENSGFDYEDASFEPPHVSVILPILSDILDKSNNEDGLTKTQTVVTASDEIVVAEEFSEPTDGKRILVICESIDEAGYFSTLLYGNNVRHRIFGAERYTLNRRIADMFWDFCDYEIDKDAFLMRYAVRIGEGENDSEDALEFYEALYSLCGDIKGRQPILKITELADVLSRLPDTVDECVLNIDDIYSPVTVITFDDVKKHNISGKDYDEIMLLLGDALTEEELKKEAELFTAVGEFFEMTPRVVKKRAVDGWFFCKSSLGRPLRVALDNYKGEASRHCLNVELGLPGDVDGKSFLTEQMGDAIRLQLYIAERIAEGDPLTVEKNADNGGYWFCHDGNVLGEFPMATIREVCSIEGFPDDFIGFEGLYVRNIVTCISEKKDPTIPSRFKETGIWLGLDITGYAKIMLA
ncbi:MAG: hypothetical protein FWF76_02415 [Oscillospiraceae bacterium]|nr:hypothetical protein [Oscillospiraceae bacterium]